MKNIPVKIGWEILLFVLAVLILTNYHEFTNKNWIAIAILTSIFGLILGHFFISEIQYLEQLKLM